MAFKLISLVYKSHLYYISFFFMFMLDSRMECKLTNKLSVLFFSHNLKVLIFKPPEYLSLLLVQ